MDNETKFKVLKNILKKRSYRSNNFKNLTLARELAAEFSYEYFWHEEYKEKHKERWPLDIMQQTAYDDGIAAELEVEKGKITFTLTIYERNGYSSYRNFTKMCDYVFEIDKYSTLLDSMFDNLLNDCTNLEVEKIKQKRENVLFTNTKNKLLKELRS